MPKRTLVATGVLCLALGALLPHGLSGQEGRPVPEEPEEKSGLQLPKGALGVQKDWEYKQIWPCQVSPEAEQTAASILAELNTLGKRGWELVSFAPVAVLQRRDCFVATFKRPLLH
jgi:hypothetical protein